MTATRLRRLVGAGAAAGLLGAATIAMPANATPVNLQDCRSVLLARAGNVDLSLSTLTTGSQSVQAGASLLATLRLCYSLTADVSLDATPTVPVVTVTPMPPDPNDTRVCASIDLAINAGARVSGTVTASVGTTDSVTALSLVSAGTSGGATLTVGVNLTPPNAGEHITARACVSTTGDVSVS